MLNLPKRVVDRKPFNWHHPLVKERGWGIFREQWFSICSRHHSDPDADCLACQHGSWVNVWARFVDHLLHDWCYPVWYFYHNKRVWRK